jgi:hypothetical protein
MTSKTFVSGTVIDSAWLNDVNTKTYVDSSDTVSYTPSGTGAVATTVQSELRRTINAANYGFVAEGSASANVTAITNAINAATAGGTLPGIVNMEHGVYPLNSQLTINPLLVQLQGDGGVTLDFSTAPASSTAIKFTSPGTAGESVSRNKMRHSGGFTLKGHSTLTLLDVGEANGGVDNAAITWRDVCFDTAAIGVNLGGNAWQFCLDNYSFTNCAIHINEVQDNAPTVTNFGERNLFTNGIHSGTGTAYKSRNYNSDAHFVGVSLDCSKFVDMTRGAKCRISHSHFETQADTDILFSVDGDVSGLAATSLGIRDCTLKLPGSFRTYSVFGCGQNYPVTGGGIEVDGLTIDCSASFGFPANKLVAGSGPVSMSGLTFGYQAPTIGLAESMNQTATGGFEVPTFALTDLSPIDVVYPPVIDTTVRYSGTNSLKLIPTGSAFVGASLTKDVRPGQKAFYNFWYKLAAIAGGAYFVITTQILDKKGNVIVLNDSVVLSGTNDWTYYSNTNLRSTPMPPGADRIYVAVQVNSGGGSGTAWVDEFLLNIVD